MTLSEPRPYKKHTKKRREYMQQKGRGTIYMVLFTFTSVVESEKLKNTKNFTAVPDVLSLRLTCN